jgi:hypothetical protein
MKKPWIIGTLAAVALLATLTTVAFSAEEGRGALKAELNGYQEVPSVSTTGSGSFQGQLSADGTSIAYTLSYSGLEGATTLFAHIHLGQAGVNGGVSAFLCGGGSKPDPCPNTGGTVSGTIVASDVIGPTAQGIAAGELSELIDALRAGVTYANVHTNKHPGGEIRGHIK